MWKKIALHLAGCISFFLLPILFVPRPTDLEILLHNYRTLEEIISYSLLLAFFYINFYFLLPRFYFKHEYYYYVLAVIICYLIIDFLPGLLHPDSPDIFPPEPSKMSSGN